MLFIYCGITSIKFFSKNYPVLCCVLCGWFLPCFTIWYPGANSTFPGWRFDLCLGIPSEKHSPSLLCILRILVNWSWRENHLKWITCAVDKYIQLTICSRKTLPNFDSIWCPILDWCNSPILSSHWSRITMRESGSIVYVYIYIYIYICARSGNCFWVPFGVSEGWSSSHLSLEIFGTGDHYGRLRILPPDNL